MIDSMEEGKIVKSFKEFIMGRIPMDGVPSYTHKSHSFMVSSLTFLEGTLHER